MTFEERVEVAEEELRQMYGIRAPSNRDIRLVLRKAFADIYGETVTARIVPFDRRSAVRAALKRTEEMRK